MQESFVDLPGLLQEEKMRSMDGDCLSLKAVELTEKTARLLFMLHLETKEGK